MYYWNTNALALDIRDNNLSNFEKKNYYLALTLFTILIWYIPLYGMFLEPNLKIVEALIWLIITFVGINITFNTNEIGNGTYDYISSVIILSFPLAIKFFLLLFFTTVMISYIEYKYVLSPESSEIIGSIIYLITQVLFFWRLNIYLKKINIEDEK